MTETVDFIGIGAARAGTTWIAEVLRAHPEICMSEPKEVRYFNRYVLPLAQDKGKLNSNHDRDMAWYLARFRHGRPDQRRGEFSPIYLYDEAAPAAIGRCLPEVRLIACLRNPADRAHSHYWLHRGLGSVGALSFEQALREEPVYIAMGYYARQLRRYLRHFERKRLLVLVFEDLVHDPAAEMAQLFDFLDVTTSASLRVAPDTINAPAQLRLKAIKRLAFSLSRILVDARLGGLVQGLRRMRVHALVKRAISSPVRYPQLAEATRRHLVDVFADDIADLESLIGRRLDHWKTVPP